MALEDSHVQLLPSGSAPASDQPPVFEKEAKYYYFGLPSNPRLVARSGTSPWLEPSGLEAYSKRKELRPVGNHKLGDIWGQLASAIRDLLKYHSVQWTSIDAVRIANAGDPSAPVVLWIGISPNSLSPVNGLAIAIACKGILEQNGIPDVDAELRESVVIRSNSPQFLNPAFSVDPTASIRKPLTPTLGISICAQRTPWVEGTGGLFLAEGGDSERIFLITARHVVLPHGCNQNTLYEQKNTSQPRRAVLLLGTARFQELLQSIQVTIENAATVAQLREKRIQAVEGMEGEEANEEHEELKAELKKAIKVVERSKSFHELVLKQWSALDNRVFGHIVFAPPISVATTEGGYTEDFAIVEIDRSKFATGGVRGNVIDLGTDIEPGDFTRMMYPNPRNKKSFTYPSNRLLPLKGIIPEEEMRKPSMVDHNGDACIMVIKSGNTTGLTIGRANNLFSFTRNHLRNDDSEVSMEWPILSFDANSGPFSDKGDSGSVIADGFGRMGGLLTGGTSGTSPLDITYATPLYFLKNRITKKFKTAHFDPVFPT